MDSILFDAVQTNPIIAAIKSDEGLSLCLKNDSRVVFILYGDICTIPQIVEKIKNSGKIAMVHADLINGLAAKEIAVDYLRFCTKADGIISTRINIIRRAKELGLYTVLRGFAIDSMAISDLTGLRDVRPDFLEVLPGVIPSVIRMLRAGTGLPVLAGGLIVNKQNIMDALEAGAMAISSTNEEVWKM